MNFEQLEARYRELAAQRQAGRIDARHFDEQVAALRTQDGEQRWWQIDPASGHWLRWDGGQWQRAEPPRVPAGGAAMAPPSADGAMQKVLSFLQELWQRFLARMISPGEFLRQSRLPLAQRSQGWWDVLSVAGGALSGYIWFLYSSIRGMPHFTLFGMSGARDVWYDFVPSLILATLPFILAARRNAILQRLDALWTRMRGNVAYAMNLGAGLIVGAIVLNYLSPALFGWAFAFREGLDFTTPLLMVGIPVGLALFRPETDLLIMPLQPLRQGIPKFVLIGVALAVPYALAFVLYRLALTQYELLHWNLALGILIPYVLMRNPPPAAAQASGTARALGVLFCLLPGALLLSGMYVPDAFADDCARDLFNLRDCLRTGGYAETMSGAAASVVSVLVNGADMVRIFVPSTPGASLPPAVPPVPPEGPADIEWTGPDGRKNVLVWNPQYKGYINILTGGLVAPDEIDKWKQNIEQTKQQTDDWRADNKKLTDAGLDAQSQALAAIKAGFAAAEANRLQQAALAAARAKMDELLKAQQAADRDYWKDVKEGFWGGVVGDVDAIPGQLKDAAKAGLKTIGEAVRTVGREITDPNNWKALGQAVVQTGKDLVGSPIQSATKVGGFYVGVATTAGKIGVHIVTHPVETIKAVAGVDNWSKAMDPNVPVTERIGRVLVGIADAAVNLTGAGAVGAGAKVADAAVDAAKIVDKVGDAVRAADKVVDAGKAADKVGDAVRGADKAADAAKAADKAAEAAKAADKAADAAKAADKAAAAKKNGDAYFKGTPEAVAARKKAWNDAQKAGQTKVAEFDKARAEAREAAKSGDAAAKAAAEDRLRKATLEVQGDKQALWDINKRPDAMKNDFNKEMGGIYQSTDRMVVDELCRKNGINPADLRETMPGSGIYHNKNTGLPEVVVVKPTNASDTIKVGADRDVTIRIRQYGDKLVADPEHPGKFIAAGDKGVLTDVPAKELTPVYNKAFHHASGADKHFPDASPKDFADKMDQVATDRLHAEAYGRGQKDLEVAISKPGDAFSDAEQVSKAAQYKSEHLYKQSHDLAAQGKFAEAETAMGEGMRQSTKQFDNQVLRRAEALQAQGVEVTSPQRLKDDMEIMKKAQSEGWSPAQVSEELKQRHTTVEDVTQRSASMLESLQKLRPR